MRRAALTLLVLVAVGCGRDPAEPPPAGTAAPPPPAARSPEPTRAVREEPPCRPAPDRLCPVDEGKDDAGFAAFRARMLDAVQRREESGLLGMIDPAIRTGFGSEGGIAEFRRQWSPEERESRLWGELETILTSGGTFRGSGAERTFWAPYVYSAWPEEIDPFTHVAATRRGVVIRRRPEGSAPAVAEVDWAILELREPEEVDEPWLAVRTGGGEEGWVRSAEVRSPISWRAGFAEREGGWRLTVLVAGD